MHRRLITRGYNLELYVFNDSLIATFWEVMGFEHTDTILPSRSTGHFFFAWFLSRTLVLFDKLRQFPTNHRVARNLPLCRCAGFSKRSITSFISFVLLNISSRISSKVLIIAGNGSLDSRVLFAFCRWLFGSFAVYSACKVSNIC